MAEPSTAAAVAEPANEQQDRTEQLTGDFAAK